MFGLFKKKSKLDKLQEKYEQLMAEWHKLSNVNRAESDKKFMEAEKILMQIDILKQNQSK